MKSFSPRCRTPAIAALASGLLLGAAGAGAAPSYQASVDPVVVGSAFTMVLRDDAISPSTGIGSFDVHINFEPVTLGRPVGTAGSAFGNATLAVTYDVFDSSGFGSDGSDDAGWARFTITRDAGAQPSSFGTDILRLDFRVVGLPPFGPIADINYFSITQASPGGYELPAGMNPFTASVGILAFVPEPSTTALLLAALGLLCTRRRPGRGAVATAAPPPLAAA